MAISLLEIRTVCAKASLRDYPNKRHHVALWAYGILNFWTINPVRSTYHT